MGTAACGRRRWENIMPDHTFNLDGLELVLPVQWEDDADDDGCGSPQQTGNAMTGLRGSRRIACLAHINMRLRNTIIRLIENHVADQLAELVEDDE